MKVVMVCDFPAARPYGGLQTHVFHLASSISKLKDIELHIISLGHENNHFKRDNLNIHFLKRTINIPRIFTIPIDTWLVKRKINELNPDIVHVQGTHYPYNFIAGKLSKMFPTILTVHGVMAIEYKFNKGLNYFGVFISYLLEKYSFSKIKQIIVCSPIIKDIIIKKSDAEIYVIPNGINTDTMCNIKPFKSVNYPSLIYFGLLEKIKGVDILLMALVLIKNQFPDIQLYIAGNGSQGDYLRQLTKKLNIENNVNFLGYVNGKEKYAYIKSADVFVVPSRYESFGIAILEAMACESSIIASNVGNIPYLLENDLLGLKFVSGNVDELAEKIIYLLKNTNLREKMGKESLKISENYKWNKIAKNTSDIYKKVVGANND